MIKLNEYATVDASTNSWELKITTTKVRDKDDKNGKFKKGDEYTTENSTYHPTLKQCLKRFLDEGLKECETVEELFKTIDNYEKIAEKAPNIYVNSQGLIQLN
ncbi:MAG: hypothetical protein CMH22_05810 [Methylophaga sp.]|nr:hypothetical protein [Methylophaga sp.]|tara:strand:+ start:85870 stop:86178 length:309 start_codon:yes stop_codon:yes gene_type:complete